MFQIAVCDGEQMICSQLEKMILDYFKTIHEKVKVEVFFTGEGLYEFIKNGHSFDLVFPDI